MDEQTLRDGRQALEETFGTPDHPRDATTGGVCVADGYGLVVKVERGQLVVLDGIGRHRRQRIYPRADRTLRRLVLLGHTGSISLDALRWCADLGVALVHVDADGRLLFASVPTLHIDARLHRALAWAPWEPVGLAVARWIIEAKLAGQARVAAGSLGSRATADTIESLRAVLGDAATMADLRLAEAQAAACYFAAWSNVGVRFARADVSRVPTHWLRPFGGRQSPLTGGTSNRRAVHPLGAILNYLGALVEAEAVLACHAVGLAPDLGLLHADTPGRSSLALDLMEPVRPVVEAHVLELAAGRTFRARDLTETREGVCRLLSPFTHELAEIMGGLALVVAPVAERVVSMLAGSSDRPVAARTPLTRAGRRQGRLPPAPRLPGIIRSCVDCGGAVGRRAQRCGPCATARRGELAARASEAARAAAERRRTEGTAAPGTDAATRAARGSAIAAARARERDEAAAAVGIGWETYRDVIMGALGSVAPSAIASATGLSRSSASKIKAGRQIAHPRHWTALAALVGVSAEERDADGVVSD